MLRYLKQVERLSYEFIALLAEAFGLPRDALATFFENDGHMQHRAKVVRYPALDALASDQGVGPHFDGGFLTFVRTRARRRSCCLDADAAITTQAPASLAAPRTAGAEPRRRVDRRAAHPRHLRRQHRQR